MAARKNKPSEPKAPEAIGSEPAAEKPASEQPEVNDEPQAETPQFPERDLICGMTPEEYFAHARLMTQHAQNSHLEVLARNHPEVLALIKERDELLEQLKRITAGSD